MYHALIEHPYTGELWRQIELCIVLFSIFIDQIIRLESSDTKIIIKNNG